MCMCLYVARVVISLLQSCVIGHYPDVKTHLVFLACMESASDPVEGAQGCAQTQGLDWDAINTCVQGTEGNALEHAMGVRTENLEYALCFFWAPPLVFGPPNSCVRV